jgi:hypothetical protein
MKCNGNSISNKKKGGWFSSFTSVLRGGAKTAVGALKSGTKKVWETTKGTFVHKSKTADKIITPAHKTNSCWMSAALGALSNLIDIKKLYEDYGDPWKFVNKEKDNGWATFDNDETLTKSMTKSIIAEDLYNVLKGKRNKMSKETEKALEFIGNQGSPFTAFEKLLQKLELPRNSFEINYVLRGSGEELPESYKKELNEMLGKPTNVTYFLGQFSVISWLNHVNCLHQSLESGGLVYRFADDKGWGLDYSAKLIEVNRKEAKNYLEKCCIGYVYKN